MNVARKLRGLVRELGVREASLYLGNRALRLIGGSIYSYELVAQPVVPGRALAARRGKDISIRRINYGDPDLSRMPLTPDVIAYRAKQGALCLGAFKRDQLIGCAWLTLGPYREDEVDCVFIPERGAWDFGVYLLPEHRMGVAFAKLWDGANDFLHQRGICWTMSRIATLNRRSLTSHSGLGARSIGRALFIRLGCAQLAMSSIKPHFRFSLGSLGMPSYRLAAPRTDLAN